MGFKDKVAIVTGGASGIGRALGLALADRGARVVLLADKNLVGAEEAVGEIKQKGGIAQAARVDVTDFDAVKAMVGDIVNKFGRVDFMFNNAGIAAMGEARDLTLDDWKWVVDVNLWGVVHGTYAVLPVMLDQKSGHIVNTSSVAGFIPMPGSAPYMATKHAIVGMSLGMRMELEQHGIRVCVICPAAVETSAFDNARYRSYAKDDLKRVLSRGKKGANPNLIAAEILRGVAANKPMIRPGPANIMYQMHRFAPIFTEKMSRTLGAELQRIRAMTTPSKEN